MSAYKIDPDEEREVVRAVDEVAGFALRHGLKPGDLVGRCKECGPFLVQGETASCDCGSTRILRLPEEPSASESDLARAFRRGLT